MKVHMNKYVSFLLMDIQYQHKEKLIMALRPSDRGGTQEMDYLLAETGQAPR